MIEFEVNLKPDKLIQFVHLVSPYEIDINVFSNRKYVDGKSILGLLGMNFANNVRIQIIPKNNNIDLNNLRKQIESLI